MKKYFSITLILLCTIFLFSGCGENNNDNNKNDRKEESTIEQETQAVNVDDIYMRVLNNEIKYVSEENEETLFSEYMNRYEGIDAKISYVLMDFDRDNEDEMVILIEAYDGFYLILNYEDGTVYGFEDVIRGMIVIKEDGTFVASGGADVHAVCRSTFEKNKRINEELASSDWGTYKVYGKTATRKEYEEAYEKECDSKKDVEFQVFLEKYEYKSSNTTETTTNEQSKSSFTEGTYKMTKPSLVGTEAEGYDTTITFKDGKANYLESYWEQKKSGTYTVNGDVLTINYTSGNEVNSIEGDLGTKSINETEVYKIDGTKLTIQSTTADSYTKAGDIIFELK